MFSQFLAGNELTFLDSLLFSGHREILPPQVKRSVLEAFSVAQSSAERSQLNACLFKISVGGSWLTFLKPSFSVCTTSLNFKKSYIPPAEYLYVSYVSKKETMKFFLFRIRWLVFITEETSVYCAVRTWSLNKMDQISSINGRTQGYIYLVFSLLIYISFSWDSILTMTSKLTVRCGSNFL